MDKRHSKGKQGDLGLKEACTALYIRVSTERQAAEGNSLDAQKEKLKGYCAAMGWNVCDKHVYEDAGVSGKSAENRPALQAMLTAAKGGLIERIVVTKVDRLARNVKDLMDIMDALNKVGCALVLLDINVDTGTPTGKLIAGIMGHLAEWERTLIGDRVMSGKRHQAAQGEYNGARCPLGYDYDGKQFVVNEQAATVRTIFSMFLAGHSINAIARAMNEGGVPTARSGKKDGNKKRDGVWYASTVRTILGNGFYAGLSQWAGVEVEVKEEEKEASKAPTIIDKATYEAAHRRLLALRPGKQLESEIARRLQHVV